MHHIFETIIGLPKATICSSHTEVYTVQCTQGRVTPTHREITVIELQSLVVFGCTVGWCEIAIFAELQFAAVREVVR